MSILAAAEEELIDFSEDPGATDLLKQSKRFVIKTRPGRNWSDFGPVGVTLLVSLSFILSLV